MKRLYLLLVFFTFALIAFPQTYGGKMSEYVRKRARSATRHIAPLTGLVRCDSVSTLTDNGCRVLASFGDIHIAAIPNDRIAQLAAIPSVHRIEASKSNVVHTDTAMMATKVDLVHSLPVPYTGKGVVIGVQDIGFDLTFPWFRDSITGEYRIKRFWDQLAENDCADTMYVGRQFLTEEDILAKGCATDGIKLTHGTHTTGIASRVAPDAELCLVANAVSDDLEFIPSDCVYKYTTATDLLGFKYIFDYADAVGKPCVINFSEGAHQDFYDNILYDEVLSQLTGSGRIIVASAGNEGYKLSYLNKPSGMESSRSLYYSNSPQAFITFRTDSEVNFRLIFDATSDTPYDYIIRSEGHDLDSIYTDSIYFDDSAYRISYAFYPNCFDTLNIAGELLVEDLVHESFGSTRHRVLITLEGTDIHQEAFYNLGQFIDGNGITSDAISTHNIHFPGASEHTICVGSTNTRPGFYNYKGEWQAPYWGEVGKRSTFSSVGPTFDGLNKPDVCAPGSFLTSGYSSFCIENDVVGNWVEKLFEHNGRTYGLEAECGTSMSAPIVTGIIALWLEACPRLTKDDIMDILRATSRPLSTSTPEPESEVGFGEIDAYAGLQYVLQNYVTGIREIENSTTAIVADRSAVVDLSGRPVSLNAPLERGIYITGNRKVLLR